MRNFVERTCNARLWAGAGRSQRAKIAVERKVTALQLRPQSETVTPSLLRHSPPPLAGNPASDIRLGTTHRYTWTAKSADSIAVPTNEDYPWLRDERAVKLPSDPDDPSQDAAIHRARQLQAIDEANQATSTPPPATT